LLNESLLKSNLFYSYLKFISKAFWYALRKDKTPAEKVFRAANISISKYDLEAVVNPIIDKIVSLDDAALEELIDQASKSSIEKQLLLDESCLLGMFNPKPTL
jgi:hypothetical protein